jgi:hypothetical protein
MSSTRVVLTQWKETHWDVLWSYDFTKEQLDELDSYTTSLGSKFSEPTQWGYAFGKDYIESLLLFIEEYTNDMFCNDIELLNSIVRLLVQCYYYPTATVMTDGESII